MEEILKIIIITLVFIPVGILAGNSAVYIFNNVPAKWFCDYGEEPWGELADKDSQRIKSYPWKLVLSFAFIVIGVFLGNIDYVYGAGAIIEMWFLLLIAVADQKYMIIPDQFVIFLALTAWAFTTYHQNIMDMLYGALLGAGVMLVIGVIGKIITKKEAMGFGDVKLMGAIGLTAGLYGTAMILVLSSILSCVFFTILMLRGKLKKGDVAPLGPYIAIAMTIYLLVGV